MNIFRACLMVLIVSIFLWLALSFARTIPAGNSAIESVQRVFQDPTLSFFSDSQWGISFSYPRLWTESYVPPNMAVFRGATRTTLVVSVQTLDNQSMTLSEYTTASLKEIRDSESANDKSMLTIESPVATTLAGISAMSIVYHDSSGGIGYDGRQVWTLRKGRAYTLSYSYPHTESVAAVQSFKTVLQSVKF